MCHWNFCIDCRTDTAAGATHGGIAFGPEIAGLCALGARKTSIGWNSGLAASGIALIIRFGRGSDPISQRSAGRSRSYLIVA